MKKVCPICEQDLPIDEFGIAQSRHDGRNLYCRSCIREKVGAQRQAAKERKVNRQLSLLDPKRKDLVMRLRIAPPDQPVELVKYLIKKGHHTRESIQLASRESGRRLSEDEVSDALAVLLNYERVIRFERIKGEAHFFLRRIA